MFDNPRELSDMSLALDTARHYKVTVRFEEDGLSTTSGFFIPFEDKSIDSTYDAFIALMESIEESQSLLSFGHL